MTNEDEKYLFPWGFHLGDLVQGRERMPLYTHSKDGGFCLLYDKVSEKKADTLLESLALQLLSTMPHESLKVEMFDTGKKKFYNLSPLQYVQLYEVAHDKPLMDTLFSKIEDIIISRHSELLCCNRKTINEHNQKSRQKQGYHLILLNLEKFASLDYESRRINNFLESATDAGVYVIPFGNISLLDSEDKTIQSFLKRFKNLKVRNKTFEITEEIFEFTELLEERVFQPLDLDKPSLLQKTLTNANLEKLMDPEEIKLEVDTKV
ncbi:hypothetical protein MNB_SV-13-475 [hydrothermal vent metagenome]|uniref:Uncharacterized protein n=1 Tax=hydrothermal vent metagenome TaxID=652676 RepID=A0A1W1CZE9_9ZZZZ